MRYRNSEESVPKTGTPHFTRMRLKAISNIFPDINIRLQGISIYLGSANKAAFQGEQKILMFSDKIKSKEKIFCLYNIFLYTHLDRSNFTAGSNLLK